MRRVMAGVMALGAILALTIPVWATQPDPEHKILICHLPPGNPDNGQAIEIDEAAWFTGGPPGHHGPGLHGGDFAIESDEDLARCEGKDTTTTTKHEDTTTTKPDETTTTKHEDTTTTRPEETTTTEPEDTTTAPEDTTTTTEPEETSTTEGTTPTSSTTTVPGESTTTAPGETTTTVGIQLGDVNAVCVSDIPFLSYSVSFPGATALSEIRFENPTGPDVVYFNQPMTGQVLWPGASDIPPFDWPGWILGSDGIWVEGDDGFLWARETVTITFVINPEVSTSVSYPPASAICAGPENAPGSTATTTPGATTTTDPVVGPLPFTGAELGAIGSIAATILVLGTLLVVSSRKGTLDTDE